MDAPESSRLSLSNESPVQHQQEDDGIIVLELSFFAHGEESVPKAISQVLRWILA